MIDCLVFPSDPFTIKRPDPFFVREVEEARAKHFSIGHFRDNGELMLPPANTQQGSLNVLYRGWILSLEQYQALAEGVTQRGGTLRVSYEQYRYCYELPRWYADLEGYTPKSIWIPGKTFDLDAVAATVNAAFGDRPVMLKDYVKSQAYSWQKTCFIPSAASATALQKVVKTFLTMDDLRGGLVFREYVPLKGGQQHPKCELPMPNEHRLFVFDSRVICRINRWDERNYVGSSLPPESFVAEVVPKVRSPFFAMDVAETATGEWVVIEVNDGGSAGVPLAETPILYQALSTAVDSQPVPA